MRIATFSTELSRKGPGLFLRDLARDSEDIAFVLSQIAEVDADIWVLQGIDFDLGGAALSAFAELAGYPYSFASAPNTGRRTGFDLDGNGRVGEARDAQGFGWFSGQGGIGVIARHPISMRADLTGALWIDFSWATLPETEGAPFPSAEAQALQRLSTTAHWILEVALPSGPLALLTAHATPPVFDGPEDRNGLRNADEVRLLHRMADETEAPFVIAGNLNLDPTAGEGRREAIQALLADPRIADPLPGVPTVDFGSESAGELRVSYVLPSSDLRVIAAGVGPRAPRSSEGDIRFTRHVPVWVDLER